jgi:glc operon protein GlcG
MMPNLISKKVLSLEAAKILANFATQKANELGVGGTIAVVDDSGNLIYLERLDGTMVAAANIAIGKAATSVGFRRPGIVSEKLVTNERPAMRNLNGVIPFPFVPLKGSYPIEINGELVGGIGIAGAKNGENDETIALFAFKEFSKLFK